MSIILSGTLGLYVYLYVSKFTLLMELVASAYHGLVVNSVMIHGYISSYRRLAALQAKINHSADTDQVLKRTKVLFAYIIQYLIILSFTMITEKAIEYFLEGESVHDNVYDFLINLTNFSFLLMLYGILQSIDKSKTFEKTPEENYPSS